MRFEVWGLVNRAELRTLGGLAVWVLGLLEGSWVVIRVIRKATFIIDLLKGAYNPPYNIHIYISIIIKNTYKYK